MVPIQKHPMTIRFLASLRTLSLSLVFDRIPITWTSLIGNEVRDGHQSWRNNCNCLPDLFNKLVLWKGGLQGFHLVALAGEDVSSGLVDIFQQQNLDVLGIKGL